MLKVLFVDDQLSDDSSSASVAARELKKFDEYSVEGTNFNEAQRKIIDFVPDLVVLDLKEEIPSHKSKFTGNTICEWIWESHFCPIVVYSAFPEQLPSKYGEHPFVGVVKKGRKSVDDLKTSIATLRPHVDAVRDAETLIRREFTVVLRDVAPDAFRFFDDTDRRNDVILRAGRRRLAALMDGLSKDGTKLASWEQYLCPPVCRDTQLGDILIKKEDETYDYDAPTSFRVVLTPSCDLVASGGRTPKVDNVLLARCISVGDALARIQMKPRQKKLEDEKEMGAFSERLTKNVLTQGYYKTVILLPCLKGRIPSMAADLRDLEFIPLSDIGISEKDFLRVASIDSPFRELVSWAYLQIACRPGLPDRDYDAWCKEIVAELTVEGNSERT